MAGKIKKKKKTGGKTLKTQEGKEIQRDVHWLLLEQVNAESA